MRFLIINKLCLQLLMFIVIGACLYEVHRYLCVAYITFLIGSWGSAFFQSQISALQAQELKEKLGELEKLARKVKRETATGDKVFKERGSGVDVNEKK